MKTVLPSLIISGGQTGADRAALDFAIAAGIAHGGFCPRGRRSEDGQVPAIYNLTETESAEYPERTRRNVLLADATAIFAAVPADQLIRQRRGGSALTAREALRAPRPFIVLYQFPDVGADSAALQAFLTELRPGSLNIAGPRESSSPGIARHVMAVLSAALGPASRLSPPDRKVTPLP